MIPLLWVKEVGMILLSPWYVAFYEGPKAIYNHFHAESGDQSSGTTDDLASWPLWKEVLIAVILTRLLVRIPSVSTPICIGGLTLSENLHII